MIVRSFESLVSATLLLGIVGKDRTPWTGGAIRVVAANAAGVRLAMLQPGGLLEPPTMGAQHS